MNPDQNIPTGLETKEEGPKIKIKIFFSGHVDAENAKAAIEDFKECDIFIPESVGWDLKEKEQWNSLSTGKINPERFIQQSEPNFPDFTLAQSKIIHNSGKPIFFIDLPEGHAIIKEIDEIMEFYPDQLKTAQNFNDVFSIYKGCFLRISELIKQREEIIVNSLPLQVASFLEENPDYKKKKELNVLIQLGSGHTPVFHTLKAKEVSVQRKVQGPQFFGPLGEIVRRIAFGKEVPQDLIAQSILHNFIQTPLEEAMNSMKPQEASMLYDKISDFVRRFNYKEIENIIRDGKDLEGLKKRIIEMCVSKNLEIPEFLK